MPQLGRRDLLLVLIGLDVHGKPEGSLNGVTRLQKFLFLLEQEEEISPGGEGFEFQPYKAGPYSPRVYDDLELLENLGLIRSEGAAPVDVEPSESTATETIDINRLSFDDLMGGFDELDGGSRTVDSFEERKFSITEKGKKRVEEILAKPDHKLLVEAIRSIKSKYAYYSLNDLLRYVYERYPEMTTESEIIDKVIGRRKR